MNFWLVIIQIFLYFFINIYIYILIGYDNYDLLKGTFL